MKKLMFIFVIQFLVLLAFQVQARELLVLSGDKSQNSKKWANDVFPEYPKSDVGGKLPAKIIVIQGDHFPDWLAQAMEEERIGKIIGTPTFIIWDEINKKELGRVEGYTQKSRFYSQLKEAVVEVDKGKHPGRREGSGSDTHEEGSGGDQRHGDSGDEQDAEMSRDIMDHMYKTPEEAKRASEALGFKGEIHTHESPQGTIYMPGPMM
jgi:hypothetical protein